MLVVKIFFLTFQIMANSFLGKEPTKDVEDNCYQKNTDYCCSNGNSVQALNDQDFGSAKKCQEHCQNNDNCFFWTYFDTAYKGNEGANMCYLKASKGTLKTKELATSGAKKCEGMYEP